MAALVIVCRNSMLLGGRVDTSRRAMSPVRTSTDRRVPPPGDGIWVYIAHADGLDRVSRASMPSAPQWRMARKMRAGEARFVSIAVLADTFEMRNGYLVGSVSDGAVQNAVETLRQRWLERLPVVWQVRRSIPDERLPCQWATAVADAPKFLRPTDDWG